jgi:hypothetical protein
VTVVMTLQFPQCWELLIAQLATSQEGLSSRKFVRKLLYSIFNTKWKYKKDHTTNPLKQAISLLCWLFKVTNVLAG